MPTWIKIFSGADEARSWLTEGKTQLDIVGGRKTCLVIRDGMFHARQDQCTHNGESLSKGSVNFLGEVICPWHGYRFQLKTGRESDERSRDLVVYPVRSDAEGVFIGV